MKTRLSLVATARLLFIASIAVLVALVLFVPGREREKLGSLMTLVPPVLWVAGVLALTGLNWSRDRVLATVAVALYAVSFLLPAAVVPDAAGEVWGYQAFTFGLLVVPVAWLANVGFVVALELHRRTNRRAAIGASAVACLLALSAPFSMAGSNVVSIGFFAWAAAPAVLGIALYLARLPRDIGAGMDPGAPVAPAVSPAP